MYPFLSLHYSDLGPNAYGAQRNQSTVVLDKIALLTSTFISCEKLNVLCVSWRSFICCGARPYPPLWPAGGQSDGSDVWVQLGRLITHSAFISFRRFPCGAWDTRSSASIRNNLLVSLFACISVCWHSSAHDLPPRSPNPAQYQNQSGQNSIIPVSKSDRTAKK